MGNSVLTAHESSENMLIVDVRDKAFRILSHKDDPDAYKYTSSTGKEYYYKRHKKSLTGRITSLEFKTKEFSDRKSEELKVTLEHEGDKVLLTLGTGSAPFRSFAKRIEGVDLDRPVEMWVYAPEKAQNLILRQDDVLPNLYPRDSPKAKQKARWIEEKHGEWSKEAEADFFRKLIEKRIMPELAPADDAVDDLETEDEPDLDDVDPADMDGEEPVNVRKMVTERQAEKSENPPMDEDLPF